MSDRDYIKEIQAGRSFVSDPVISKTDNAMIAVIGAPIMNEGKVSGFYVASYPIANVVENVSSFKLGETGTAIMTTSNGTFIYHPDDAGVGANR